MPFGFMSAAVNQVMVVAGCGYSEPLYVSGGRVFVWPICQTAQYLDLNIMTAIIESFEVLSQEGVKISVSGVAQVKIEGRFPEMRKAACQHFLGKTPDQVKAIVMVTLEGHQRAIMGTMTVEEIYQDRKKFAEAVYTVASQDLQAMGITIVSYTIKDIRDQHGYLKALGMKRTAEVQRDARIGEAEAHRDAIIKQAEASQARLAAKYLCDADIAQAERDYQLRQASFDASIATKQADSELEYQLQTAISMQKIKEEATQQIVVEREKMIEVQMQEALRREKELVTSVKLPSEAEKTKLELAGAAAKARLTLEAEAQAEAIKAKGQAEAEAIELQGKAHAEAMQLRAEAYRRYGKAAVADMIFQALPKVTAEVAAPLSRMDKLVMISADEEDVGAARVTGEVIEIITQLPPLVEKLTGLNIVDSFKDSVNIKVK
eukprot:comp19954_c0_seq1/m.24307 comp19954_c0_seq1/g.24307  ORF comp19954_c0_seq1/g.24307 comp19954_c0_seq1/m.24307 type:complete len:433 (-) comp19954_c0_seq1:897-2195(-)